MILSINIHKRVAYDIQIRYFDNIVRDCITIPEAIDKMTKQMRICVRSIQRIPNIAEEQLYEEKYTKRKKNNG